MSATEVQFRREKIWRRLIEIIAVEFNFYGVEVDQILPTARFYEDLKWDELDLVELVMCCEGDFDVEIPDEEQEKLVTLQDVWDYLDKNVAWDFEFSPAD